MIEGNLHDLIIARGYWLMWRRLTPCEIVGMNGGYWRLPAALLTVLARDGKVARIVVDAVKGTLVGER